MYSARIPDATIKRLSLYIKQLHRLIKEGEDIVRSKELAQWLDLTSTQVRKDLSYFGRFGRRKKGYDVQQLLSNLRKILGVSTDNRIALFGVGNLGRALLGYKGFSERGFSIDVIFDTDPQKIGTEFFSKPCHSVDDASKILKQKDIKIAIIAVPDDAVDKVLEIVLQSGVTSILNFTQRHLQVPVDVMVRSVDFTDKLEQLTYFSRHMNDDDNHNHKPE